MTLSHPGWLGLLALAAPLVALHLRRRRRVRVVVPSLLAFDPDALDAATPRGAGIRPRDLAGLLLELGALGALSLAAAGPVEGAPPPAPRAIAIVLDGSHSTAAAGRFDEMRTLARRALDAAGPDAPATLLLAAGEPRVLATAADPRPRVAAALRDARPAPRSAGALAAAADAAAASGAEVLVLTDGCDPDAPALAARGDLRLVSVGRPERNRAAVGAVLEARRGAPPFLLLRVLDEDGTIRDEDRSALLAALPPGEGAIRLAVAAGAAPDALPGDDALEVPFRRPAPIRVAVAVPGGRPDPWVAAALEACGDLLDRAASTALDPADLGRLAIPPDVLVAAGGGDGTSLHALVFGAGAGPWGEAAAVAPGDRSHPVLRGVDPSEWILTRARTVEALAGDAVLLHGPEGPVAAAGVRGGARRVLLGFDPAASTVPLSASWPVLVRNALTWLAGDPEPVLVPGPGAARGSLPDADESRLTPRVPRNADAYRPPPRPDRGPGPRSLAPDLAALGAALLLLEALLFLAPARRGPPRRDS